MAMKPIATLLILSAFAMAGANSAFAQDRGFAGGGSHGGDGGSFRGGSFRGHGFHRQDPPVVVGGFVDGYGPVGGYGYGYGAGNGYGDWYGISSGHDECPLFRQRVKTPEGWRVQMVPVC